MSKIKKIDFYFDVSSPYSYLAHTQVRKFEKDQKIKVNYCPVFLAGLHRTADWYKIKYQFNRYFPIKTIHIMRGSVVAIKEGFLSQYVDKFFKAAWVDSLNLNDEKIFEKFLKNMDLNPESFIQKLNDPKIKDDLKNRTDNAFKKGIFGCPTFVVGSKIYFGQDRLEFVFREALK